MNFMQIKTSTNPSRGGGVGRGGVFYATSHWFIACLVIFEYILKENDAKTKTKISALNINPACWTCTVSIFYFSSWCILRACC